MKSFLKHLSGVALLAVALLLAPAWYSAMSGHQYGVAYAGAAGAVANASGPTQSGLALGGSTTPQGLFGQAVTQLTNPSLALASYALGQSCMVVYFSTQSPSAVAANSTPEQAFTVTGVAAGSVVAGSKPTVQAGLGVVGWRVSAANTVQANYCNVTAGSITPTASEKYWIVEFRGPLIQSTGTITPVIVPTLSTSEQLFTLVPAAGEQGVSTAQIANEPPSLSQPNPSTVSTGTTNSGTQITPVPTQNPSIISSGKPQCLVINKLTGQAGLGYWARISANNQIAISYSNTSGAGITPTAEAYTFVSLRGLALHGMVTYGVNVGTLSAVAQGTSATQTVTATGLAATDVIWDWLKPTEQAGLIFTKARVSSANTITLEFGNIPNAGGNITPTASEIYKFQVDQSLTAGTGNGVAPLDCFTGTLGAPAAIATITGAEQSITVTGLKSGTPIVGAMLAAGAGFSSALGGKLPTGVIFGGVRCSADNTLGVNLLNVTAASITPPALQVAVLQAPIASSGSASAAAGSFVSYPIDAQLVQLTETMNMIAAGLAKLGASAGG